jgi:hypothetical protein
LLPRGSGEYDEHAAAAAESLLSNSNISPEPKNIHLFHVDIKGIRGHCRAIRGLQDVALTQRRQ